jgi:hypothetical protein
MNFIIFGFIILAFITIGQVLRNRKNRHSTVSALPPKLRVPAEFAVADMPVRFGYKCNWFAVRTEDTQQLAGHIGLKDAAPCNWQYGVDYAYQDRVFVSPPVDGWSFVISKLGLPIPEDEDSVDLLKTMLSDLSQAFSEAQYFGTYRVVGYDAWMKAENGKILRAYAFVDGENILVEGEPTAIETRFNLINTLSEAAEENPNYFEQEGLQYPDEQMTMEVAGSWSINPQDLDGRKDVASGPGMVGVLV